MNLVILGAGGFAREVLDLAEAVAESGDGSPRVLGFIVDAAYAAPGTMVNDVPVLGGLEWLDGREADVRAVCAIGAPADRRRMVRRAQALGVRFATLVHPSVRLSRWVSIGEGAIVTAGCLLTTQIRIGAHVHLNLDCTIGHDVVMEDYATLAPGVHVSGNVRLQEGCYVGTGANIIEKRTIGAWAVVGAGSTIVTDAPSNATVVGVPGKVVKSRPDGWHLLDADHR